ncbi:MAG: DUF418 domain-containing protein [Actinomycetota bacterium]|nr:DUF418 domain-containing protein [Actinomycetota bacterium]
MTTDATRVQVEASPLDGTARRRLPGPDVVRAVALIGVVVMNYHGYLLIRGGEQGDDRIDRIFDPWDGPLATRFAATFVLVAGVGVTLLTTSRAADQEAMTSMRWRLVRRGLLLYLAGLVFDTVWSGTILPFYGAMFVIAAVIVTWAGRWVLTLGAASAVAGAAIAWWRFERQLDGHSTEWLDRGQRSPRALLLDVFVNGTHPLLPWLAFFAAGIVLGRMLGATWWRPAALGFGATLWVAATIVSDAVTAPDPGSSVAMLLASDDPFDRGLVYAASALGTALLAFAVISWVADRYAGRPAVEVLRIAGEMSLTLYVLHGLVFNLLVDWWGVVRPTGLDTALTFAVGYWIVGLCAAWLWSRRFDRGPLEIAYRRITA